MGKKLLILLVFLSFNVINSSFDGGLGESSVQQLTSGRSEFRQLTTIQNAIRRPFDLLENDLPEQEQTILAEFATRRSQIGQALRPISQFQTLTSMRGIR